MNVPIAFANGRDSALHEALPKIFETLAEGKNVVVHCNQSFHRGPVLLVAILSRMFGWKGKYIMKLIGKHRTIYFQHLQYLEDEDRPITHYGLWQNLRWAMNLTQWQVPTAQIVDRRPAASQKRHGIEDEVAKFERPGHRYFYRCMRQDLSDLEQQTPNFPTDGADFFIGALQAIQTGSNRTSPFLHCSWSYLNARKWWIWGRERRGERNNYIVRIDTMNLQEDQIFDVSNRQRQQRLVSQYGMQDDDRFEDYLDVLAHAEADNEVLLKWRGCIPFSIMEVMDEHGRLQEKGTQAASQCDKSDADAKNAARLNLEREVKQEALAAAATEAANLAQRQAAKRQRLLQQDYEAEMAKQKKKEEEARLQKEKARKEQEEKANLQKKKEGDHGQKEGEQSSKTKPAASQSSLDDKSKEDEKAREAQEREKKEAQEREEKEAQRSIDERGISDIKELWERRCSKSSSEQQGQSAQSNTIHKVHNNILQHKRLTITRHTCYIIVVVVIVVLVVAFIVVV